MNIRTIQLNNHHITSTVMAFLVMSVIAYMYFLSLSVVHVVMRKEATEKLGELRSNISSLEATYIKAKHNISAQVASLDGFSKNQEKIFISKSGENLVLRTDR